MLCMVSISCSVLSLCQWCTRMSALALLSGIDCVKADVGDQTSVT